MRIRSSVTRVFGVLIGPVVTLTALAYFGSYLLWGERGVLALEDAEDKLGVLQQQLSSLESQRIALAWRVTLMERGDSDLVEEVARTKLMDAASHQIAIRRSNK